MTVFTPDYISTLRDKWESRAEHEWPLIARIALLEDRCDDRALIEECVAQLDPADQPKITHNLRLPKQFLTTFGELLIGDILVRAGTFPRYELSLNASSGPRTPDWLIETPTRVVCDVFTAGQDEDRNAHETSLAELEARLKCIQRSYFLRLEVSNADELDAGDRKTIAIAVENWLSTNPPEGEIFAIGSATVEVMVRGGEQVTIVRTEAMHIVEAPANVAENFADKAKRYGQLELPLIVAAVKANLAELDEYDVKNVLFGREVIVAPRSGKSRLTRRPDGIFHLRQQVSGAIWLEPFRIPPVLTAWENPEAVRPLPNGLLESILAAGP